MPQLAAAPSSHTNSVLCLFSSLSPPFVSPSAVIQTPTSYGTLKGYYPAAAGRNSNCRYRIALDSPNLSFSSQYVNGD